MNLDNFHPTVCGTVNFQYHVVAQTGIDWVALDSLGYEYDVDYEMAYYAVAQNLNTKKNYYDFGILFHHPALLGGYLLVADRRFEKNTGLI